MAKPAPKAETIKKSDKRWQSDVIVDMIKRYGFEYIALNPGASYRGLHDSLVNYGENDPPMMLCQHEKIAVQIAQQRPLARVVILMSGLCLRLQHPGKKTLIPACATGASGSAFRFRGHCVSVRRTAKAGPCYSGDYCGAESARGEIAQRLARLCRDPLSTLDKPPALRIRP